MIKHTCKLCGEVVENDVDELIYHLEDNHEEDYELFAEDDPGEIVRQYYKTEISVSTPQEAIDILYEEKYRQECNYSAWGDPEGSSTAEFNQALDYAITALKKMK